MYSQFIYFIVVAITLSPIVAETNGDDEPAPLYIRIANIHSTSCFRHAGYTNRQYLQVKDENIIVSSLDEPGKKVSVLKLPGQYRIEFRDMQVGGKDLQYLVGDISVNLRVPLFGTETEVNAIPYLINSERGSNFDYFNCSRNGRLVSSTKAVGSGDEFACRYCDICSHSSTLEKELTNHKLIKGSDSDDQFSSACQNFYVGETYSISREIDLPDADAMNEIITEKGQFTEKLQQAFAEGTGRIIAKLRLFSKPRSVTVIEYCERDCKTSNFNTIAVDARCWWCMQEYNVKKTNGLITSLSADDNCIEHNDKTELAACYNVEFYYDATYDKQSIDEAERLSQEKAHDPCKQEIERKNSWCKGCWWCGEAFCSKECRCFGHQNCE